MRLFINCIFCCFWFTKLIDCFCIIGQGDWPTALRRSYSPPATAGGRLLRPRIHLVYQSASVLTTLPLSYKTKVRNVRDVPIPETSSLFAVFRIEAFDPFIPCLISHIKAFIVNAVPIVDLLNILEKQSPGIVSYIIIMTL